MLPRVNSGGGVTFKELNALISDVSISLDEPSTLEVSLVLTCQGVDSPALNVEFEVHTDPKGWFDSDLSKDHLAKFLEGILQIAGVRLFSELKGRAIRVRFSEEKHSGIVVYAVGHIIYNEWLDLLDSKWDHDRDVYSVPEIPSRSHLDTADAEYNCLTCLHCRAPYSSSGDYTSAYCSVRSKAFLEGKDIIMDLASTYEKGFRGRAEWLPSSNRCGHYLSGI